MTIEELHEMQKWTLEQKVFHAIEVMQSFTTKVGGGKEYLHIFQRRCGQPCCLVPCKEVSQQRRKGGILQHGYGMESHYRLR